MKGLYCRVGCILNSTHLNNIFSRNIVQSVLLLRHCILYMGGMNTTMIYLVGIGIVSHVILFTASHQLSGVTSHCIVRDQCLCLWSRWSRLPRWVDGHQCVHERTVHIHPSHIRHTVRVILLCTILYPGSKSPSTNPTFEPSPTQNRWTAVKQHWSFPSQASSHHIYVCSEILLVYRKSRFFKDFDGTLTIGRMRRVKTPESCVKSLEFCFVWFWLRWQNIWTNYLLTYLMSPIKCGNNVVLANIYLWRALQWCLETSNFMLLNNILAPVADVGPRWPMLAPGGRCWPPVADAEQVEDKCSVGRYRNPGRESKHRKGITTWGGNYTPERKSQLGAAITT